MNGRGPWSKKKTEGEVPNCTEEEVTPSYQKYARDAIFTSNTGETELEKRVLNYKVVCGGKGEKKMEEYDGVRWRRNVHEGILVRVSVFLLCCDAFTVTVPSLTL